MNIPSLLVELDVEPIPSAVDAPATVQKISFELSRESLETILDGLGRIRDQLGAMG
jgi:COMM domain containing 9